MSLDHASEGQSPQLVNTGSEESASLEIQEAGAGGGVAAVKRVRYLRALSAYVPVYQTQVRAMKRWVAIGRDAVPPEVPPLDDPPRMAGWWQRHMKQRVPERLLELAKAPALPTAPAADATPGPLFAQAAPPPPAPDGDARGFVGALQRVRSSESAAGAHYRALLARASIAADQDLALRLSSEAEQARRAWEKLVDQLREMERDAVKILPQTAAMWLADEVLASQEVIHLALRDGIRNLLRRVRPKLTGLDPAAQDALWSAEVESLFAALRTAKFAAPGSLPAAA